MHSALNQTTARSISGDYQHRALLEGHPVQRQWHLAKLSLVESVLKPLPGGPILDAGCGSGVVSAALAERGATVVGVDSNHESIRFAGRTFARDNLAFVESSIFEFHETGFEAIICFEFIEHFTESAARSLLEHLRRRVQSGGRLLLTTPNYRSAWPLIESTLDLFQLTPRLKDDQHLCRFEPNKLARFLTAAGWTVLEMGSFNGLAPFLAPFSETSAERMQTRIMLDPKKRRSLRRNLLYAYCQAGTPK
jgi:2-polyprenyl-3-methyl-5-hydroxy-6-metoxy-1,4-benzoquinol methylase